MTAASLTHLPLQVGGVVLASTGRAALWIISRYMRNPLTHTAIAALVVTSAMAGSNALFMQQHEHPSPLFAPEAAVRASAEVQPVFPATRPKKLALPSAKPIPAKPAALAAVGENGPIGNKDVFELQRKLELLNLFTGTIDGYYGPQTARAIKKFEELQGMTPKGELSREIIEMILAAPLSAAEPKKPQPVQLTPAQPAPAVLAPKPAVEPAAAPAAVPASEAVPTQSLAALVAPRPLSADLATGSITQPKTRIVAAPETSATLLGRPLPDSPEEALEMAAETANDAIDTIVAGVQSVAMTKPGKPPAMLQLASTAEPVEAAVKIVEQTEPVRVASLQATATPGVPLQIEEEPTKPGEAIAVLDTEATPEELMPAFSVTDPIIVAKVQRGLGSLGFLHGPADGVAGEATAKAIRNFEVYFNYKVTGRITPELLDLLLQNGAAI